jgi:hypothetical protein
MAVHVTSTSSNGNHSRRVRPEQVALTVERLEHLTIEINSAAAAEIMQRLHDLASLGKALEAWHELQTARQGIVDRVAVHAGNGAGATTS